MPILKYALAATTALGLIASASTAHATAYAYGNINFSSLALNGLQSSSVTLDSANVATSDGSNYTGYAPAGTTASATSPGAPLTQGSDVLQAYSGPIPAPAENTYTQALLSTSGARGDAQLVGNLITGVGTGANAVAEGRLITGGTAGSFAGTSTGFNVTVTVNGSATFQLTFNASDALVATTTAPGEFSSASVSSSFTIAQGVTTLLTYAPATLNTSVTSTGSGQNFTTSNPLAAYASTPLTLGSGTYQFSLVSGAKESLTAPVPEPVSLALLGAGLAAVGLVRRRRA